MPTPLILSYARKTKLPVEKVEAAWARAKEKALAIRRSPLIDRQYWALVNGLLKKELGLNENKTSFLEIFESTINLGDKRYQVSVMSNKEVDPNLKAQLLSLSHKALQGGIKAVLNYPDENPSTIAVATFEGTPVGWATYALDKSAYNVYVNVTHRGAGLARELKKVLC